MLNDQKLPGLRLTYFNLPDEVEELPSLDSSQGSIATSITDEVHLNDPIEHGDEDFNLWSLPDVTARPVSCLLLSWDTFQNAEHKETGPTYLSEAGKHGLDIALKVFAVNSGRELPEYEVVQKVLLSCLFELGLGRDSMMFKYEKEKQGFTTNLEDFMLSGFSADIVSDVILDMKQHGMLMREVEDFLVRIDCPKISLRTELALRSAVTTAVYAIEQRRDCNTLTQLVNIFEEPKQILMGLNSFIAAINDAPTDEILVSRILNHLELTMGQGAITDQVLQEIACRTAAPWLLGILESCGIRFVDSKNIVDASSLLDVETDGDDKISIGQHALSSSIREAVRDCVAGLQLLRNSHPDHPVLHGPNFNTPFALTPSWEFIERVQAKASSFQDQLEVSLAEFKHPVPDQHDLNHNVSNTEISIGIPQGLDDLTSINMLGLSLGPPIPNSMDRLSALITSNDDSSDRYVSIRPLLRTCVEMSIWPLLTTQNRLVQQACMCLLFQNNHLRSHIALQYQYQLFGNGDFTSRLSHALFDPSLSSGERKSARSRTTYETGLRLETRQNWPPATSELRLALMGILAESFRTSDIAKKLHSRESHGMSDELPGDLSFSIRDLSDEELELCKDASNIEALDFLCISYRSNKVLQSVITESSLRKYDRVFKHLLRLLRVQQATQSMVWEHVNRRGPTRESLYRNGKEMKLCMEIHRFISGLYDYTTNVAIAKPWHGFQLYLEKVEESLMGHESKSEVTVSESIAAVRESHESTLESILTSLFMTRKYQQVKSLIDDILRLILKFSSMLRLQVEDTTNKEALIETYRQDFRKLALKLCGFLMGRTSASSKRTNSITSRRHVSHEVDEAMLAEQLLLRLNFSNYFQ